MVDNIQEQSRDLITWLINYGYDRKIGLILTHELNEEVPSQSFPEENLAIINMNYFDKASIPFQIAHEMGHILNKDTGVQYYSSSTNCIKSEYSANARAIQILLLYCDAHGIKLEPGEFMVMFGIPQQLLELVQKQYKYN